MKVGTLIQRGQRGRSWPARWFAACLICGMLPLPARAQDRDVTRIPLDSLLSVPVHAAARYAQALRDAPASVTVISAEEIASFGHRTVADVLASVAGIHLTYDRNYTFVGVRGIGRLTDYNNRILILLNGHPVQDVVSGATSAGPELGIDPRALERVEVVRGPASALYGTGAMLAVINLVTRTSNAGDAVALQAATGRTVEAAAQHHVSLPRQSSLFVSMRGGQNDGADHYYAEYDDGSPGGGIARNLDWQRDISALVAANLGDFRLQVRRAHRSKGVPTGSWGTTFGDARRQTSDDWFSISSAFVRALTPALTAEVSAAVDDFVYQGGQPMPTHLGTDRMESTAASLTTHMIWDPAAILRVSAGTMLQRRLRAHYHSYIEGQLGYSLERNSTAAATFAQTEFQAARWLTLTTGVRFDAESDRGGHFTPRLAAVLRVADATTLKLLFGQAFRAPNAFEASFEADGFVRNPDLQPERIRTSEVLLDQQLTAGATIRVSLFHDHLSRLIEPEYDAAAGHLQYRNSGNAETFGGELEMMAVWRRWLLRTGGSATRARSMLTGETLTNVPEHMARFGISGPLGAPLAGALQLRAESGRLTRAGNRTAATGLVDGRLAWQAARGVGAALLVKNLFDARHAVPGRIEHRQDVIAQDGRHVRLEIQWRP